MTFEDALLGESDRSRRMKRGMRFMGITLTLAADGESWRSDPRRIPIVVLGRCVDGTWFGLITCRSRSVNLGVSERPTLRAAKVALQKQVRSLRAELETLK